MQVTLIELATSIALLSILALIAIKLKLIDKSGVISALLIGSLILFFGGWKWLLLMFSFLLVAGLATKYKYNLKFKLGVAESKGGVRAWKNVIGNGGVATIFAIAEGTLGGGSFFGGFLGAVSTATADTLATEIGLLYPDYPRMITNLRKKVPPGTSGAISPYGEIAIFMASIMIGMLTIILNIEPQVNPIKILIITIISGFLGSTFDSFLGATIQAQYWCEKCKCLTETSIHSCGEKTKLIRGFSFINNHIVNFTSTLIGGLIGYILYLII